MLFNIKPIPGRSSRLTVRSNDWSEETILDDSFRSYEVAVPAGIDETDVEAFVYYIDGSGQVDPKINAAVVKTRKRRKLPPRK